MYTEIELFFPVAGNLPGVHGVDDLDEGGDGGVDHAHGQHDEVRHQRHLQWGHSHVTSAEREREGEGYPNSDAVREVA